MKTIYERRSIRKYTDESVSDDEILKIVKAGMNAPSAGNEQPWHFILVNDRTLMNRIQKVHPHSAMLAEAKWAVIICCDTVLEKHEGFWIQDCSAAVENMLLEITDMGLGSVWLGVYPRQERIDGIRNIFGLPGNIIPFAVLPVGHPGESKPANDKLDKTRIHLNKWDDTAV